MKYIKYILPAAVLGLSLVSCHDDDETYGVLDGLGVVYRSQSIDPGTSVSAKSTNAVTLSFNNLIQIVNPSAITLNGQAVDVHTDGMDLVIDLNLKPWTEYTLSIADGAVARADDATVTAPGKTITFNTNQGLNLSALDRSLVNPNATKEAKAVYEYLLSVYSTKQISGAMGAVGWGTEYTDFLNAQTGKYPAIVGFDYLHIPYSAPGSWINYADISKVKEVWDNGGIVQIQWHWNVPTSQGTTGTVTTVWEGESVMPANWSGNLQLTDPASMAIWADAKVGDVITVYTKDVNTAANAQGSFKNGSWSEIASGTEYFNITGDYTLTITADILASLQTGGLIVSGHDYTVTKVTVGTAGAADGKLAFYADGNQFNPANVYVDGTWENEVATADVDKLAGYLKLLQDANIPVLWRPLHEAAGDYTWGAWFWWGSKGTDVTKRLYIWLYDKLTKEYGLNNLIWVWTMCTSDAGNMADTALVRAAYPGDQYVDIVGTDLYPQATLTDQTDQFDAVNAAVDNHKMVALTECGNLTSPETAYANDALWLYFMQWYDMEGGTPGFINYDGPQWGAVTSSPYVLFRGDLPSFRN